MRATRFRGVRINQFKTVLLFDRVQVKCSVRFLVLIWNRDNVIMAQAAPTTRPAKLVRAVFARFDLVPAIKLIPFDLTTTWIIWMRDLFMYLTTFSKSTANVNRFSHSHSERTLVLNSRT